MKKFRVPFCAAWFMLALVACTSRGKNSDNLLSSSIPVKINKVRLYQVPGDSLQPLKTFAAGAPLVVRAGEPRLVSANLNVHPVPAVIPAIDLSQKPKPSLITPGLNGFAPPIRTPPIKKIRPSGIPEVVQVKDAYTKDINPGNFSAFIKLQGLKHSNVNCILQDRRGNLWIGTDGGGATCYDGKYFTHYTDATGLPNNVVRGMVEDKNGKIWLATDAGLCCFDGKNFTTFLTGSNALTGNMIRSVILDNEGNIWFSSDGGVFCYNGKETIAYIEAQGLCNKQVYTLCRDHEGAIWIGTANGLMKFSGGSFARFGKEQGIPEETVRAIYTDNSGQVWVGTINDGVFCFTGKKVLHYTTNEGLSSNNTCAFLQDRSGVLWIGTEGGGVSCYNGKSFTQFSEKQGLSSSVVLCIFQDKSGTTWLGTYGGGITRYNGNLFTHFTENEGLSSNVVRSVLQDNKGHLWFGTNGGGVCCYDGKNFSWFTQEQGLSNNVVRSILEDRKGNLWLGTHGGGVCRYDGTNFFIYTTAQGLSNDIVRCLYEDRKGNIWMGTYGGGAVKFDGTHFTVFNTREGMSHNVILCITEDERGNIWFGTEGGGLTRYDGRHFSHFTERQGLCNNDVWSLYRDEKGNFWMATGGGGVGYYNGLKFAHFTTAEGLSNDFAFSILHDRHDNLWIGTRFGLNKLTSENRHRLEAIVKGGRNAQYDKGGVYFKAYTHEDGFLGIGCFGNAICEDKSGTIWIGSNDRLTAYHPQGDVPDSIAPQIHLNGIDVFNENMAWPQLYNGITAKDTSVLLGNGVRLDQFNFNGLSLWYGIPQQLSLAYTNNYLTFKFIGVTLRQSARVRYQYKLDGLDEHWSALVNRTEAPYGNLSPGQYTFRVKAMNSEGLWSKEFKYAFTIRPPWWQTFWFRTIMVLVAAVLLYLVYYWRTSSLRRQQKKLEQTVVNRTAELRLQKEEAEKQKGIVEKKQREITDSITYAKHIQEAILPRESLVKKHLPESFIFYKPKDIVAGDFYFFEATDTHLFYAAADCTGHGVPGALVSVVCSNALTRCVKEFGLTDPGEILDKARQLVIETFDKSGQDVKDGMDISIISIDLKDSKGFENSKEKSLFSNPQILESSNESPGSSTPIQLSWAGANNPLWVVNPDQVMTEVSPDKQPIGKTYHPRPFTTHRLELKPGSFIFLFTDGYADQFGGADGKKLKYKKLKDIVLEVTQKNNDQRVAYLETQFNLWSGVYEQVDDVCIIGIKL